MPTGGRRREGAGSLLRSEPLRGILRSWKAPGVVSYVSDPISREPIRRAASFSRLASDLQVVRRKMLSLAALTAAAQLDDDAPSGYVASYSEGEHTVQSELFYLPPSHSVEKRLREMASEVDRPRPADAIASGSSASSKVSNDSALGQSMQGSSASKAEGSACQARSKSGRRNHLPLVESCSLRLRRLSSEFGTPQVHPLSAG